MCLQERAAWDIFIWYGGLVRLGKALNEAGVTREFAKAVGGLFPGLELGGAVRRGAADLLLHALWIRQHHGSHSGDVRAVRGGAGRQGRAARPVIFAFASFTNFAAGLTHYGTTPSPMFFATGYVSFREWWKVGFIVSLANIAIWSTIGFAWWKVIGIW